MLAQIFADDRGARYRAGVTWRNISDADPRWYEALGTHSDAGLSVSPEVALTIGVVFRAINVLAHAVATVPLVIYRNLADGEERATEHPQYRLLHDQPNAWQTSFLFRHLMVSRAILWGNFHAQIVPGFRGAQALVPLEPQTTRVVDQLADGRLLYVTRPKRGDGTFGEENRLLQDDVVHVRGYSKDGKNGVPLTEFARNAMGLALAAEKHGSMFMRRGAQLSGVLSAPGTMEQDVRDANEKAWNQANTGFGATGKVPLLEGGMEFKPMSSTNKDSQWLESRDFQIAELGPRFLGVPGLLCGYPDKTATYASAQEMTLAFVKHGVMPLTDNIRAELNRSFVIGAPDDYHADFILEGLLRGDVKTRYEAHRVAVMTGWKTRNEVRRLEGDNPGPSALDRFFEPLNLGVAGEEPPPAPSPRRPPPPPQEDGQSEGATRLREIAETVALHLVRKEIAAVAGTGGKIGAARRYAADRAGWRAWLAEFYEDHAKQVSERLRVPYDVAATYCNAQRSALEVSAGAVERFESEATPRLVSMALKGRAA